MVIRIIAAALVALLVDGGSASAALIEISFRAIVTRVEVHPIVGNPHVVMPLGTEIVGAYRYEINPGNPEQAINGGLRFSGGGVSRDNLGLNIQVRNQGDINWAHGDLYQAWSPNPGPSIGENYLIDLESSGDVFAGFDYPTPPDLSLFDVRANFFFSAGSIEGYVLTTARLVEMYLPSAELPAPAGVLLLLTGLAAIGVAARRRLA